MTGCLTNWPTTAIILVSGCPQMIRLIMAMVKEMADLFILSPVRFRDWDNIKTEQQVPPPLLGNLPAPLPWAHNYLKRKIQVSQKRFNRNQSLLLNLEKQNRVQRRQPP